jgi:hypothetical protein
MKQITNKEYEEWRKYKAEKAKGHTPDPSRDGNMDMKEQEGKE